MFKWSCLAVAVIVVAVWTWMLNDLRLHVKQTVQPLTERLPTLLGKTEQSMDSLHDNLPELIENTRTSTETMAELAEDVRQLKELAGVSGQARDKSLVAYATSVLDFLEKSGAVIGAKKLVGKGLKDPQPAREWVVGGRKKALWLTAISHSRADFLKSLCTRVTGSHWYVQVGDQEPVPLLDWLKANHAETKESKESAGSSGR